MWCHIRLINPQNKNAERINEENKKNCFCFGLSRYWFSYENRWLWVSWKKLQMNVNVFCYENNIYPIYILKKSNTHGWNVLLLINEEKSHYVFIKDLDELMYSKTKTKNQIKKTFVWFAYKISLLNKHFLILKNNVN